MTPCTPLPDSAAWVILCSPNTDAQTLGQHKIWLIIHALVNARKCELAEYFPKRFPLLVSL